MHRFHSAAGRHEHPDSVAHLAVSWHLAQLAWDKPPDYSKIFQSASHIPGKKVN
jgi:hypothetical protein